MYDVYPFYALTFTRSDLLAITSHFADTAGTCLLYSGSDYDSAKESFLCLFPIETITVERNEQNPWDQLIEALPCLDGDTDIPEWAGFFSYEMGAYSDDDVVSPYEKSDLPYCYFQRCGLIFRVNHRTNQGIVYLDSRKVASKWAEPETWEKLKVGKVEKNGVSRTVKPLEPLELYCEKVHEAIEQIYSGNIYQVNLSQQTLVETTHKPYSIFSRLVTNNPAPFCAYLHVGPYTIISSSPERLLRKKGSVLETRPIKGTIRRGKTEVEDEQNRMQLIRSTKDRAELLMITDLMRNDLGRVSLSGSVDVKKLYHCEAYENVFHLLSIIQSRVLPRQHSVDILRVCYPGGSITGCPKIRSMEVIHDLEKRARGIYTGSIGYFTDSGDFDFNIAIRTMLFKDHIVDIQLGGAIVADSDPSQEYQETLDKGASIFKVLV